MTVKAHAKFLLHIISNTSVSSGTERQDEGQMDSEIPIQHPFTS